MQGKVLPHLKIHPIDFGEIASCRQSIILRIGFDLSEFLDLVLKIPDTFFHGDKALPPVSTVTRYSHGVRANMYTR